MAWMDADDDAVAQKQAHVHALTPLYVKEPEQQQQVLMHTNVPYGYHAVVVVVEMVVQKKVMVYEKEQNHLMKVMCYQVYVFCHH